MEMTNTDVQDMGRSRILRAVMSALSSQRQGVPLTAGLEGDLCVASWAQQQLWMLEQLAPGEPVNNLCVAYRLRGDLSVERLRRSINHVVERHDVLRTTFSQEGRLLTRQVHPGIGVELRLTSLHDYFSGVDEEPGDASRIAEWVNEQAGVPFVSGEQPLLRASLLQVSARDHVLVLTTHHLAFDGWSFDILMRELCACYAGDPFPSSPNVPRYGDYAAWQRLRLQGEESAAAREFWSAQLRHAPAATRLPSDGSVRPGLVRRSRRHSFALDGGLAEVVERIANQTGTTDFMVYLAAYIALLHRCTAARDVMVGFPVANRCLPQTRMMIGPFVHMFPLRTVIESDDTFGCLLSRVRDAVSGIYAHQEYPVAALGQGAELSGVGYRTQCNFAYQNVPHSGWKLGDLEVESWDVGNGSISNDMTLFMWRDGAALKAHVDYDSDRFHATTIVTFCEHFQGLLRSAAEQLESPVAALVLDHPAKAAAVQLHEWSEGPVASAPRLAVHEAFRAQARATPDAVAVVALGRQLDYASVDRMSDRIARYLLTFESTHARPGRGTDRVIAFILPPSLERIVLMLAILKTGAAYLALDGSMPQHYTDALMEDASVAFAIVEDADARNSSIKALSLREVLALREDADRHAVMPLVEATRPACLMYTSGSSGQAKRVVIAHQSILNIAMEPAYIDPVQGDVFLQLAPMTFDASLFEIWGALLNGGRLVVLPPHRPSLAEIGDAILEHRVGVLWLSSGLFEAMMDACPESLQSLRQLLIGGDVVSAAHADRYLALHGAGRLFNAYGPTENTTFTTVHPIVRELIDPSTPIPIGKPIPGARLRVLDTTGRVVPVGIVGEACVGGLGMMLSCDGPGNRLIVDDLGVPGDLLYCTGDAVRWRSDGCLDFVSRLDGQIKVRGFRVEPAQVEAALRRCGLLSACAVAGCEIGGRARALIAAVVPEDRGTDRASLVMALRTMLQAVLPQYMVPKHIVVVDALPLTANGKIDRRAIHELFEGTAELPSGEAPRSQDEVIIHAAFANTLGHARFGIHDDFFSVGGDSLGALQLLAELQRDCDASLSLADVFTLRTVASLATRAGSKNQKPAVVREPIGLVQLKRGNGTPPLFLAPGGKGSHIEMTLYAELMRHVGGQTPVYGIITKPEWKGRASLEARAASYIVRLRDKQGCGPYIIAGECIGGLVALEMARQLKKENEDVVLIIMDTWLPSVPGALHYYGRVRPAAEAQAAVDTIRAYVGERRQEPSRSVWQHLRVAPSAAKAMAGPILDGLWRMVTPERSRPGFGDDADFDLFRDAMKYRPARYPGDAIFMSSQQNLVKGILKPWRALVDGELNEVVVPGNHATYLREHVSTTANALRTLLDARLRSSEARSVDRAS